jgi:hypothetical protein
MVEAMLEGDKAKNDLASCPFELGQLAKVCNKAASI